MAWTKRGDRQVFGRAEAVFNLLQHINIEVASEEPDFDFIEKAVKEIDDILGHNPGGIELEFKDSAAVKYKLTVEIKIEQKIG